MEYTKARFEAAVSQFGEVFFVLDSDREYIVHGTEGYDFINNGQSVRVEGKQGDEWVVAIFDLDDIEHIYTHKEI